jgi:diaminopimelate epimerase
MKGTRLVKMSGAGNDFLMLGPEEARRIPPNVTGWVRRICRRGLSVGADGVVFVDPLEADRLRVTFHNPDGSAAFCGNGTRCAARFAHLRGWVGQRMVLDTAAGKVRAEILGQQVQLNLPPPHDRGTAELEVAGEGLRGRFVEAGVPHFVVFVTSPATAPLERWGPAVRHHARFAPAGTNVDDAGIRPDGQIALRTWERGVEGETLACGSGAVAAAFVARLDGGPASRGIVPASGVPLEIRLPGPPRSPEEVVMTGDARMVFEATVSPEASSGFPVDQR